MSDSLANQLDKTTLKCDSFLHLSPQAQTDLERRENATDRDWKSELQAPVKDARVQTEVSSDLNFPRLLRLCKAGCHSYQRPRL